MKMWPKFVPENSGLNMMVEIVKHVFYAEFQVVFFFFLVNSSTLVGVVGSNLTVEHEFRFSSCHELKKSGEGGEEERGPLNAKLLKDEDKRLRL